MTFDEWWVTLTEPEQKLLGRTNAKYVWVCARDACAEIALQGTGEAMQTKTLEILNTERLRIAKNIKEKT
jgi:hypothetical protein